MRKTSLTSTCEQKGVENRFFYSKLFQNTRLLNPKKNVIYQSIKSPIPNSVRTTEFWIRLTIQVKNALNLDRQSCYR